MTSNRPLRATLLSLLLTAVPGPGCRPSDDSGVHRVDVGELSASIASPPRTQPAVVCCASVVRSARAAAELTRAGFDVHDLGTFDARGR